MNVVIEIAETGRGTMLYGTFTENGKTMASTDIGTLPRLQWNRRGGKWVMWVGESRGEGSTVMVAARRLAWEMGATAGTITVRRHYGTGTRERREGIARRGCQTR